MKKFDVILFDADDTLFDFQKSEKYNLKKTFDDFDVEYNEQIEGEYNKINKALWEEYNKGNISKEYLKSIRFKQLFDIYGIKENSDNFNEAYLTNLSENSYLMDEAEEVCEILSKEFKLAIVTNAISSVAHRKIEKSGISTYISYIFVSDDIGFQKPDTRFFDYVFNKLNSFSKDRMIIVGDSLTSDIQGGVNSGLKTCWFNQFNKENKTEIKPTYEIRSLKEIISILEE